MPIVIATCVSETVGEDERGTALGVTNFFAVIVGTTLMPVVAGRVADVGGITAALWIPIAAQIVVVVLILGIKETAPRVVMRGAIASAGRRATTAHG